MSIRKLFSFVFLFFAFSLLAQQSQSVSVDYFNAITENILPRIPVQSRLADNQQYPIPQEMQDTLQKYDWYLVADYSNIDRTYFSKWNENRNRLKDSATEIRFELLRFEEDGLMREWYLDKHKEGAFTLEKSLLPEERLSHWIEVRYEDGIPLLITARHGVRQQSRILYYADRLLILSTEAVPGALNSRIYTAYVAVDKIPAEVQEEDLPEEIISPFTEAREVLESTIEQKEEVIDEPVKKKRKKKERRKKRKKDKKKSATVEFELG